MKEVIIFYLSEQLINHKFVTKPCSEFTKVNLKDISKNIVGSQIKINSKKNQSIWVIFEAEDENENFDNISPKMYDIPKKVQNNINPPINPKVKRVETKNNEKLDEKTLKKEFLNAYNIMNDDLIYIEPKLIPIILGDDPTVMTKVSEFNEDNF